MLRIFGDRQSLLAALSCHWSYELIQLDQPLHQRSTTSGVPYQRGPKAPPWATPGRTNG